jgi:hypothetical protein
MASIKSETHIHNKYESRIIGFFFVGAEIAAFDPTWVKRVLYSKIRKSPH